MDRFAPEQDGPSVDLHADWIAAARDEVRRVRTRVGRAGARPVVSDDGRVQTLLAAALPSYAFAGELQRGGQGVVYRGRHRGTGREVAIKVLRAGALAGADEKRRFEREARILGQLHHPNIVSVLDSGEVHGHFYFIMPYVRGHALDEHVRQRGGTLRELLGLFVTVCDAVHAAHVRGIIHRDLKPSNIRVDEQGAVHVMDFGLAKVDARDSSLSVDGGDLTMTGQFVGSLPWASPEQVDGHAERIDVRTDVYALGVLLYQLVTGSFPYDVVGTIRRVLDNIVSAEPARPSSLNRAIDDELECIILKCLRKAPEERYDGAGALARELRRYLAGEPIEARRHSGWYVLRKAIRRHRVRATIIGLAAALLINTLVALALISRQEVRLRSAAEAARDDAQRQARRLAAVNEFLNVDLLAAAAPDRLGRDATLRAVLDAAAERLDGRFADDPEVAAELHVTLGDTYRQLGQPDAAVAQLARAVELWEVTVGPRHPATLHALNELARAHQAAGALDAAAAVLTDVLARWQERGEADSEPALAPLANLAWLQHERGATDEALRLAREAYERSRGLRGDDHPETVVVMGNLAMVYLELGRLDDAVPLLQRDYELCRAQLGDDHPDTLTALANMATLLMQQGDLAGAEERYRRVLASRRRVLGVDHPQTLLVMNNLANACSKQGRLAEAAALFEEARPAALRVLGAEHATVATLTSNLGWVYQQQARYAEAAELQAAALAGARAVLPAGHPHIGLYLLRLGAARLELGQAVEAAEVLGEAHAVLLAASGPDDALTQEAAGLRARAEAGGGEGQTGGRGR
jgi:tetratricopeptide (TPR) repeat protein/tRNA A-37 threonylcarbamoyl transferase component Bud32